ncbi:major facilitator superfamily domain-containing protein 6-A [Culicoides brevitarsis]|uniref:major facilitator superfamily domain-containing protein 6-A n=1 Tax=Culicoides brevitarsis TaxID=469753 RepID=UPI00307C8238
MSLQINKRLLPLKAHYFTWNAGTAPVVPFVPTIIKQLGFSPSVLGTIYAVLPIVGLLSKPLFCGLADKFHKQKMFFLLFQFITAISFFSFIFIPSIVKETDVKLDCNENISNLKYCLTNGNSTFDNNQCALNRITSINDTSQMFCRTRCFVNASDWETLCKYWSIEADCSATMREEFQFDAYVPREHILPVSNCLHLRIDQVKFKNDNLSYLQCNHNWTFFDFNCKISCNDSDVTDIISSGIPDSEAYGLYQFWIMFFLLIISWAGMAVVVSVGDAIAFEMLGDQPHLYGNQRLWGAVGWGTLALITGFLIDKLSAKNAEKDYTVIFYLVLILILFDMLISSKLQHKQTKVSSHILKDVSKVFTPNVQMFFLWCIAVGFCAALVWNLLFWHLEDLGRAQGCDYMDYMKTLQGIIMAIQCFGGELPFFILSGWILRKIGHIHTMTLVLCAFGIRFLLYSLLVNPWYIIPIEFLNGLCFGLFYATMASYASIVAPAGTEATLQGLTGAVFEGIGVSLGSLLGGYLSSKVGGSLLFRYYGIGAIILGLLHALVQKCFQKPEKFSGNMEELQEEGSGSSGNITTDKFSDFS